MYAVVAGLLILGAMLYLGEIQTMAKVKQNTTICFLFANGIFR